MVSRKLEADVARLRRAGRRWVLDLDGKPLKAGELLWVWLDGDWCLGVFRWTGLPWQPGWVHCERQVGFRWIRTAITVDTPTLLARVAA